MSVKPVRALINSAEFPFLYTQAGRSVLESEDLASKMGQGFSGSADGYEYNVPQLIYCENAIPFAKGMFTASYSEQAAAHSPVVNNFDQAIILRDAEENQRLFVPGDGTNYVFALDTLSFTAYSSFDFTGELVTRAYVEGRTFICYETTKIIEWDETTSNFIDRTASITFPTGKTIADVRGIAGISNYLVFWTDIEVYWCAPEDIFQFDDLDHGSGNQIPIDIKGRITAVLPIPGGAICYTARNAIGITYTYNPAAPFTFKEISNSGGVPNFERVTAESNDTYHYAWTSSGLQRISINPHRADTFAPAATDFLVGNIFEQWDYATNSIIRTEIPGAFSVKLSFASSRYLIISYGQERNLFDAALVYDTVLERWGRLRIEHCDCFMYPYPSIDGDYFYADLPGFYADLGENTYEDLDVIRSQVTPPKKGIAFLKKDGSIQLLNLNFTQVASEAVLVYGHFQQRRGKLITFHKLQLEGTIDATAPTVKLLLSPSGHRDREVKNFTLRSSGQQFREYGCRHTGVNGDLVITGPIILTGLLMDISQHGSR